MGTKAVGYARVSTGEQADTGSSLEEQETRIRAWAENEGLPVAVYRDAVSGRRDQRPALSQALADDAEVFVVAKLDRLGRGARYLLELFERFEERGTRFIALSDGIDTATMGGKTIMRFLAVIAETESDNIAERNRMAAAALFRQGRYNGPPPEGYRFEDGELVVVESEAFVVRRIFSSFNAGETLSGIARSLNRDGIPTKRGGKWRQATVGALIRNPVYVGRIRRGDAEVEGSHDAILDEESFERAVRRAGGLSRRKGSGRGRVPAGAHLFRGGSFRCGNCGESMTPRTPYNRNHAQYYLCAGVQQLGCTMPQVRREVIDSAVYAYFEQVALDVEATRNAVLQGRATQLAEVRALLSDAEAEAQRSAARLARVRRDYADGVLPASDWMDFREELAQEKEAADLEAGTLRERLVALNEPDDHLEAQLIEHLAQLRAAIVGEIREAEGVDAVRAALDRIFEGFVLHQADRAPASVVPADLALVPGFVIEPIVRDSAISKHGEFGPIYRREPLYQAENKYKKGVGYRLVEGT